MDVPLLVFRALKSLSKIRAESSIKAGFRFEDHMKVMLEKYGLPIKRKELELPSFTGQKHQFDITIPDGNLYWTIECKREQQVEKAQAYAFVAKILDHALGVKLFHSNCELRGIFVSQTRLKETIRKYLLCFGVLPMDPNLPPIEYLLERTGTKSLRDELKMLKSQLSLSLPSLLEEKEYAIKIDGLLKHWERLCEIVISNGEA